MKVSDIAVPEVYRSSWDFRFFLRWFELALEHVKNDTENLVDLYDPLRCPEQLLWMLGDTVGYKYDSRLPAAFNRLVLLYFMSMIRHKGSKDGVTLAAEVNLAQFNVLKYGQEKDILHNRLEDTSIPVNSVYVTSHPSEGYIEVVYFAEEKPIDACLEYVRPLGMYMFEYAGVRYDGRTKISVDARLTNSNDLGTSIGPTRVGHYRREDYARLQKGRNISNTDGISIETDNQGNVVGKVSWTAEFAEISDVWVLTHSVSAKNGQIDKAVGERLAWTITRRDNDLFDLYDPNGICVRCSKSNYIGESGNAWSIVKYDTTPDKMMITTEQADGTTLFLCSNSVAHGRFRGYTEADIAHNPDYYNKQFMFYKMNESSQTFDKISDPSEITDGQYIIANVSSALYVLDNSGLVVGRNSGEACVTAVQARNTPQDKQLDYSHTRNLSYYRNSDNEQSTGAAINAGYRAFYSLQLCNNEHVVKANLPKIFGLQCHPDSIPSGSVEQTITTHQAPKVTKRMTSRDLFDKIPWNLAYDRTADQAHTLARTDPDGSTIYDVAVVRGGTSAAPIPAVNPAIKIDDQSGIRSLGDAVSLGQHNLPGQHSPQGYNRYYTNVTENGVEIKDTDNSGST